MRRCPGSYEPAPWLPVIAAQSDSPAIVDGQRGGGQDAMPFPCSYRGVFCQPFVDPSMGASDNTRMQDSPAYSPSFGRLRPSSVALHASSATTARKNPSLSREGLVILAIVVFAGWLRLTDLGYASFSHAEAWRAIDSFSGTLDELRRFPPLQLGLLRLVQRVAGSSEFVLRLPSALAGLLCVVSVYALVRRHVAFGAAALVALATACHPALIHQSRILKVFSLEAMVAATLCWFGLAAYRHPSRRSMLLFAVVAVVGISLTFTGSLVAAAWCAVLIRPYFSRDATGGRSLARCYVVACTAMASVAAGVYLWLAGSTQLQLNTSYYFAEVERVWPSAYSASELAQWFAGSSFGAMRYLLGVTFIWPPLDWMVGTAGLIAALAGSQLLWNRARPIVIVAGILAVEVVLLGMMKKWPFGELRTMTFLVPIMTLLIGCGLYDLGRRLGSCPAVWFMMATVLAIPAARAAKAAYATPQPVEHLRPVIQYVDGHCADGEAIFVYYAADDAFQYYWKRTDLVTLVEPRSDRGDLPAFASRFDECLQSNGRVWFVFTHGWGDEEQTWTEHLVRKYELIDQFESVDASARLFRARPERSILP